MGKMLKLSWNAPRSKKPIDTEIMELISCNGLPLPKTVLAIFNNYACLQMRCEADAQRLFKHLNGKSLDRWGTLVYKFLFLTLG